MIQCIMLIILLKIIKNFEIFFFFCFGFRLRRYVLKDQIRYKMASFFIFSIYYTEYEQMREQVIIDVTCRKRNIRCLHSFKNFCQRKSK